MPRGRRTAGLGGAAGDASSVASTPSTAQAAAPPAAELSPQLRELRTTWQFAAISQWIHLFGDLLNIEDFDVEVS
jgi:hypothetical protein